jgi:hypothetical protein
MVIECIDSELRNLRIDADVIQDDILKGTTKMTFYYRIVIMALTLSIINSTFRHD